MMSPSRRRAEVVDEAIREHAVGEPRLAAGSGPRAVERRLHRRRRDPVRIDDERLDREHDRDRTDDRGRPVDGDAQPLRPRRRQADDGVPRAPCALDPLLLRPLRCGPRLGRCLCFGIDVGRQLRRPTRRRRARPRPRTRAAPKRGSGGRRAGGGSYSVTRRSGRGSRLAATRRSARGRPRAGCPAPASHEIRPGACSAGTRARRRARPRSSPRWSDSSLPRAPGSSRTMPSTSTIAGSSPPERTYGPIEIASVARCETMRSSKPSNRAESSVTCSSVASSSIAVWSSRRPVRRQRHDPRRQRVAVDAVERGRDHVDAQHHAGAAAVRLVVDLSAAERREVAVVEEPKVELGPEHGRTGRPLRQPGEGRRNEGEDIEAHRRADVG